MKPLVSMLKKRKDDEGRRWAANVIALLTLENRKSIILNMLILEAEHRTQFGKEGCIKNLVELLLHTEEKVVRNVSFALSCLTTDNGTPMKKCIHLVKRKIKTLLMNVVLLENSWRS